MHQQMTVIFGFCIMLISKNCFTFFLLLTQLSFHIKYKYIHGIYVSYGKLDPYFFNKVIKRNIFISFVCF
jgi:hypothetical protein